MKQKSLSNILSTLLLTAFLTVGISSCSSSDEPPVKPDDKKEIVMTDRHGNQLTVESKSGIPEIGDAARPDGRFELPDGTVIVVKNGKITEISEWEEVANRTILVYMVAANSLGSGNYDMRDIAEMQIAALNGHLEGNHLLVYHHNYKGEPVLKEIKDGTGEIDTLKVYSSTPSSLSIARMEEVISDMKSLAPAKDYGMVMWSHANGWLVMNNSGELSVMGRSRGDDYAISTLAFGEDQSSGTTYYMNTGDLGTALRGKELSFIFFDCCYMASVEAMYDLRETAPLIGGSVAEIIAEGMPYQITLPYLFAEGEADFVGAVNADYEYVNAMSGYNRTGTFSIMDMAQIDNLAKACKEVYSYGPVYPSDFRPQKFMYESTCYFYDLAHMLENLELKGEDVDESLLVKFEEARQKALEQIDKTVIFKANTPYIWPGTSDQTAINHHCGLSAQFLRDASGASSRGYNQTAWWNDVASYMFE